jgi:hypothetical protein
VKTVSSYRGGRGKGSGFRGLKVIGCQEAGVSDKRIKMIVLVSSENLVTEEKSMKDPILYYKVEFGCELQMVKNATDATIKDSISIVSLLPNNDSAINTDGHALAFNSLTYQRLFLFSFFFTALIDQAIHSALREEHPYFYRLAQYPKFVGILATYHHNIHPCLLILVATLYTNYQDQDIATEEFFALADFFVDDYEDFIENKYPSLTGRLKNNEARKLAIQKLYAELSNALAFIFIPRSLRPYSSLLANVKLYEKWVGHLNSKINAKLKNYE